MAGELLEQPARLCQRCSVLTIGIPAEGGFEMSFPTAHRPNSSLNLSPCCHCAWLGFGPLESPQEQECLLCLHHEAFLGAAQPLGARNHLTLLNQHKPSQPCRRGRDQLNHSPRCPRPCQKNHPRARTTAARLPHQHGPQGRKSPMGRGGGAAWEEGASLAPKLLVLVLC